MTQVLLERDRIGGSVEVWIPPAVEAGQHRTRFEEEGRTVFKKALMRLGCIVREKAPRFEDYACIFLDEGGCLRDRKEADGVVQSASAGGIRMLRLGANTLFTSLPFEDRRKLRTFTDFRKAISRVPLMPEGGPIPEEPPFPVPRRFSGADPRSAFPYQGGEPDALAHLRHYLSVPDRVHSYKSTRNRMLGIGDSSKFSPFLATGVLSVRRVWFELVRFEQSYGASEGTEWLKFELLWREYFRWLERESGESFYTSQGLRRVDPPPSTEDRGLFEKWTRGETGIPFIDANMRELNLTGFMSNRGRQNVASHFIHELRLPWWWGADYFSKMLLDSDPAQNFGNWSYLAGVGSDPRSFGGQARKFDLARQIREYDPDGEYQKTWL